MNGGAVTDGSVVSNQARERIRQMNDAIILDIGMVPHDDAIDIGPEHRVVPDTGVIPQGDVPDEHRAASDVGLLSQPWLAAQKLGKLFCDISHKLDPLILFHLPKKSNAKSGIEFYQRKLHLFLGNL
jgi:hypothetical protein